MTNFSNTERTDMILLYGEVGGNAQLARDLWIERFPDRPASQGRTFISTCTIVTVYILNAEEHISNCVEEEPGVSTRRLAAEVVSHFTVHRILKEKDLHPYNIQKVQALQLGDPPRRMNYCQWLLEQY
ncbi:hypothetical protein BDFB_013674, partial [Asbolus verrucosus]